MRDLGLGNHAWPDTEMRPRRSVDEKGMADVHITCAAGCTRARPLERRGGQPPGYVAREYAALAIGREQPRDVEVRSRDQLRWRVIASDIREQKQCQEPAPAAVNIHPPPSVHVVAAIDVPPGVARIP